jgi:endonuclease/exonuclease/phosphatase family metal-dependent hydrolase
VTHLGLLAGDRARQVDEILARIGPARGLRILGGDLNDGPRSDVVRRLATDALFRVGSPPTYPAALPLLRLDHLLVDRRLRVVAVHRPGLRHIRGASDHLPIVVTLEAA